jgi:Ferric reductase like transmembrane component
VPFPAVRPLTSAGTVRPRRSPGQAAAHRASRALLTIVVMGALATTWMWWRDMSPPRGIGDWLSDGGGLAGLLGGYGLGVLLVLMSRVPWLERRIGAGELAGWHARGGRYVLILLVAHTLLIIWGYAASTRTTLTSETTTLLARYADVLAATVALGLLLGVWLASAGAIRRRLRYETWFYLHLYAYLAAALAFAHEFATGADFATHPLARIIWALFYVTVAAAVVWYRFCVPVRGAFRHRLRVTRVRHETPVVTTLFVGGRRIVELRAEPGQFFRWRFLTREGWWQSHPFSPADKPRHRQNAREPPARQARRPRPRPAGRDRLRVGPCTANHPGTLKLRPGLVRRSDHKKASCSCAGDPGRSLPGTKHLPARAALPAGLAPRESQRSSRHARIWAVRGWSPRSSKMAWACFHRSDAISGRPTVR